MNIGIVVPPYLGHIYPTFSVGEELISRGHVVYWLCHLSDIESLLPSGGILLRMNWELDGASVESDKVTYGMQSLVSLHKDVLAPLNESILKNLGCFHESIEFDFIVSDLQAFAGALFAHQKNIPHASSVTAPAAIDRSDDFPEVLAFEHEQVIEFQKTQGCFEKNALAWSAPLVLIYVTQEFLQKHDFPSRYKFVGPSIEQRREVDVDISELRHTTDTRPKVLVSMGSLLPRDEWFIELLVEAFSAMELVIVLVADPSLRDEWPDNFRVYAFIPQLEVLPLVDAVVCHAGQNTVCETLNLGLPLVTLPVSFDQSYVATKVQRCGAGVRLKYRRLKATHLATAIQKVLTKTCYRDSAKKIQQSFINAGGEIEAANHIEELLNASKPASRIGAV